MHWWKLSIFLSKSLVLCTTGIFRIGVTTKDPNITAISIPWRKSPYRHRNAIVHHCNAKTLRLGVVTMETLYVSFSFKIMIPRLARTYLWMGNDGIFSNIFDIGKEPNLKTIYNPIKNCWLRRMYVCFYATNHLRFCGIYTMRIWPI